MNKGLKVLSGVLALTIGLATAGMVGALSKGAQDILKVKEPTVPEYKFYEAITTKPEYSALLKKADKEYKGLKADSAEWARLSAMACNAAQGIESINNQLDAIPHFLALASDFGVSEAFTYAHLTEPSAMVDGKPIKAGEVEIVAFAAGLQLMTPEKQELDALVKENKALEKEYNKLEDKLDAYKVTGAGVISGNRFAGSLYETWKANFEAIQALAEKVSTPEYKEAAAYVANYTEEKANTMKAQLLKEKTDLNGLIAFVTKIANDNGLKLMDKCALPQDANVSEADKAAAGEAKKDTVPNTGAGDETQPSDTTKPSDTTQPSDTTKPSDTTQPSDTTKPTEIAQPAPQPAPVAEKPFIINVPKVRYFAPLIPTKVVKTEKLEKKAPAFTFEALNKLELLPRAQKTEVVVEVEAPAFTFEALNKLELLPRR